MMMEREYKKLINKKIQKKKKIRGFEINKRRRKKKKKK